MDELESFRGCEPGELLHRLDQPDTPAPVPDPAYLRPNVTIDRVDE